MSFLSLRNDLLLRLVDWGLPAKIIREFLLELQRRFAASDPAEVPSSRIWG